MRRVLRFSVLAVVCAGLLSSCSLLSPGPAVSGLALEDSNKQSDVEMQKVTHDVETHNAAALKSLFSVHARAMAPNLESGIEKFLAFFPSGYKNLGEPDGGPGETDVSDFGKRTVFLESNYKVRDDRGTFYVYFAYYPINQAIDPKNVGLYALGVAPYNPKPGTDPTASSTAFFHWQQQFSITKDKSTGTPSVYVAQG